MSTHELFQQVCPTTVLLPWYLAVSSLDNGMTPGLPWWPLRNSSSLESKEASLESDRHHESHGEELMPGIVSVECIGRGGRRPRPLEKERKDYGQRGQGCGKLRM